MGLLLSARVPTLSGPAFVAPVLDDEEMPRWKPRSASYELGRARGYVTGRAEPTERDAEWWAMQPGVDGDDDFAYDDFGDGMLDGRDQATSARLRLPCPAPPSPDALAAAREGSL